MDFEMKFYCKFQQIWGHIKLSMPDFSGKKWTKIWRKVTKVWSCKIYQTSYWKTIMASSLFLPFPSLKRDVVLAGLKLIKKIFWNIYRQNCREYNERNDSLKWSLVPWQLMAFKRTSTFNKTYVNNIGQDFA